jgi:hypothetical protein
VYLTECVCLCVSVCVCVCVCHVCVCARAKMSVATCIYFHSKTTEPKSRTQCRVIKNGAAFF